MLKRQFFIYLDGPTIGVSLDISRHTFLTKNENSHYDTYFVRHQTSVPLIILSSVFKAQIYIYIYRRYIEIVADTVFKAILQVLIYKALYDKSYLGSKTTMTSGEWTCLISFATAPLTCSERRGSEKFKMKI